MNLTLSFAIATLLSFIFIIFVYLGISSKLDLEMRIFLENKLKYEAKVIYFDILATSFFGDFPNSEISMSLEYLLDGKLYLNNSSLCISKDNLRICENITLNETKIRLDVNNENWYRLRVEG